MILGLELIPMVTSIFVERNIRVRSMVHEPMMFKKLGGGKMPSLPLFETFRTLGAVPVSPTYFYKLFSSKFHFLLYPGGIREALHRKIPFYYYSNYFGTIFKCYYKYFICRGRNTSYSGRSSRSL